MNTALDLLKSKTPIPQPQGIPVPPVPKSSPEAATNDNRNTPESTGENRSSPASGARPVLRLVSGHAPDPTSELPPEPEPDIPESEEENRFKRLRLATSNGEHVSRYVGVDADTGTVQVGATSEEDFIELWAVDAWECLSEVGAWLGLDLSDIETEPDELEQGRKAAARLYKLAHDYPRLLGWMLHAKMIEGGDALIVAAFFLGKASVVIAALRKRKEEKQKEGGKAHA